MEARGLAEQLYQRLEKAQERLARKCLDILGLGRGKDHPAAPKEQVYHIIKLIDSRDEISIRRLGWFQQLIFLGAAG